MGAPKLREAEHDKATTPPLHPPGKKFYGYYSQTPIMWPPIKQLPIKVPMMGFIKWPTPFK